MPNYISDITLKAHNKKKAKRRIKNKQLPLGYTIDFFFPAPCCFSCGECCDEPCGVLEEVISKTAYDFVLGLFLSGNKMFLYLAKSALKNGTHIDISMVEQNGKD